MRNVRLLVEYEGTNYYGWQVQDGLPTVQGALADAVTLLTGEEVVIRGASRTDAGVHALGQVVCFNTASTIPAPALPRVLNSRLPGDIVVTDAVDVDPSFDPRRNSKSKTYRYTILNRPVPSALQARFSWFVYGELDLDLMRQAARHFIGEKDFASFMAAHSDAAHSVREVTSVEIERTGGDTVEVVVRGTAFLRHMVRIMVGTLVEAGRGSLKPDDGLPILDAKDRRVARMTAPPQGLCLVKIEY